MIEANNVRNTVAVSSSLPQKGRNYRIALYSPGMIGLGHIRRNLTIARTLSETALNPAILLIAESREASAFAIPQGVDCLTLPAVRKELDGVHVPRYLDIALGDLIRLRSRIIRAAIEEFDPDILIVDHLPRGASNELNETLELLKRKEKICILGMRDIIGDPAKVQEEWIQASTADAIRKYYQKVWIYGDPRIYNIMQEYNLPQDLRDRFCYTGYLDRAIHMPKAIRENHDPYPALHLPPGQLALCLVGGGQDGIRLAESFVAAVFPAEMNGIVVTGPFMSEEARAKLDGLASRNNRVRILEFIPEPLLLLNRAERIIAMGGYNTVCEILSFGKRSLIVPRVKHAPEQTIRAKRLQELGLVHYLSSEELHPNALSSWLFQRHEPPIAVRESIDLSGLERLPLLMLDLLAPFQTAKRG